ncbi:hypothetical protein RED65_01953 [Oceanobacter sp. RED65]|uniref:Conjugal transfer mating pair stabilization protein TraN n=1 Tax=Bermanella marisrubri TaxID=207949 RepID=Q1MY33_9GAMM|nr:hypothetical protein RED65_01953 [Oceanobacter sp. RED65] [Bermanella marisrubri]
MDNAVNYQGTDVPGKQYHDDPSLSNMENAAHAESSTNEISTFVDDASSTRPPIVFDMQNDPLFKRVEEVEDKAHSLTDTYSGCVELPVGQEDVTDVIPDTCLEYGDHDVIEYTCRKNAIVTCSNKDAGKPMPIDLNFFNTSGDSGFSERKLSTYVYRFGNSGNNNRDPSGSCEWYYNYVNFYVADKEQIHSIRLKGGAYDDWVFVKFNGNNIFSAIGDSVYNDDISGSYKCERGFFGIPTNKIQPMKPHVRDGWNRIYVRNQVTGTGQVRLDIEIRVLEPCGFDTDYQTTCPSGEYAHQGELVSSQCVEGAGTRYIGVFPYYRYCWAWDQTYTRNSDPNYTREEKCDLLLQQGCVTDSSTCTEFDQALGYCKIREHQFRCFNTHSAETVTMCGDTLICSGGDCGAEYQQYEEATDDFKKATATFEAAKAVGKSYSEDLNIFKGKAYSCEKDNMYDTKDCCKDSGWATGIFTSCSTDEKQLGIAREDGRAFQTHYWEWRRKVLGETVEKWSYRSFCVYPNKLGRIIMEQAYQQIGHIVEGKKTPDCRGLTEEELETLDFESIDLSEFYEDVMNNKDSASMPAVDALKRRLESQIQSMEGS